MTLSVSPEPRAAEPVSMPTAPSVTAKSVTVTVGAGSSGSSDTVTSARAVAVTRVTVSVTVTRKCSVAAPPGAVKVGETLSAPLSAT